MEVAISVDRFDLIALAEGEADLRLFAGMQLLALIALLGLERYPFDVVLRQHGVLYGADLDMDDVFRNTQTVSFSRRFNSFRITATVLLVVQSVSSIRLS